jgi:hypothetical protein
MHAAWLDALPAAPTLRRDGWQSAEVRLDGGGTVEVRAKRGDDDRVAVTVRFSDPAVAARTEADAAALRTRLEAAYGAQVDLSFSDGRGRQPQEAPAPSRPALTAALTSDAPTPPTTSAPSRANGSREWIG